MGNSDSKSKLLASQEDDSTPSSGTNEAETLLKCNMSFEEQFQALKTLPSEEVSVTLLSWIKTEKFDKSSIICSLQDRNFLFSIIFRTLDSPKKLGSMLEFLILSVIHRCSGSRMRFKYNQFMKKADPAILAIIMFDVPFPENVDEYFTSVNTSSTCALMFNIIKNTNLSVNSLMVDHINIAKLFSIILLVNQSIKDGFSRFLKDYSGIISSKFPILVEDLSSPRLLFGLISCMDSLDDYMTEHVVDTFLSWIKKLFDTVPDSYTQTRTINIMRLETFDKWVDCLLLCCQKNNKNTVKSRLNKSPLIIITDNIIYRLDKSM